MLPFNSILSSSDLIQNHEVQRKIVACDGVKLLHASLSKLKDINWLFNPSSKTWHWNFRCECAVQASWEGECAPESWSNYFFQPFSTCFFLIFNCEITVKGLKLTKKVEKGWKSNLTCFKVHAEPKSWSKYTTNNLPCPIFPALPTILSPSLPKSLIFDVVYF